jgi:TetR/AcrR family fatty acid metabolism transcriptional regulator
MPRIKDPKLEQKRREQIMATVYLCLAAGSHRAMTLERVAQLAGVSKGMVNYYFKTKNQLIVSTIEHFLQQHTEQLLSIVHMDLPIRDRLERLIEEALPSRDHVDSVLRFQTEVWSYGKEHPEAFEAIQASYVRFRQAAQTMVDVGVAEGYVQATEGKWIYLLLHGLIDGMSFQIVMDPSLDLVEVRARILKLIDDVIT